MLLADIDCCIISLIYQIFYLIWFRLIRSANPSFYQPVTSVTRHIHIFTATSRQSTNVLWWIRICFGGRNSWQSVGDEFRWFEHNRCSFCFCNITCYVNLFSVPLLEMTATQIGNCLKHKCAHSSHAPILCIFYSAFGYIHKNNLKHKNFSITFKRDFLK